MLSDSLNIEASKELGLDPSSCWPLERCWHVTRDAGEASEIAVRGSEQLLTRNVFTVRLQTQDATVVVLGARRRLRVTWSRGGP